MKAPKGKGHGPLEDIAAATAARLVQCSNDLTLVLDRDGTILSASSPLDDLQRGVCATWQGKRWVDTVTPESREKLQAMLRETLAAGEAQRWRQVTHPVVDGQDLPVSYMAMRVAPADSAAGQRCIVACGRELRATVQLQHRLVESQQAMERDYWRFREAETRYRTMFQTAAEAVLVVDAASLRVQEANPAAEALFERAARLVGASLPALLLAEDADALQGLLAEVRSSGRREPLLAHLPQGDPVQVSAALFRQEQTSFWLVRVAQRGAGAPRALAAEADAASVSRWLQAYAESASEGLVFTDLQGRVLYANAAFASMAQLASEDPARGEMLDRWLGATGVELGVLANNLRQRGAAGLLVTRLRGEFGALLDVEVSSALLPAVRSADARVLAFAVRDIGRRLHGGMAVEERSTEKLAPSASELTELVGRMPMKDIVNETTDLIEKLCIETALQMTNDNRALAAQLLGLSRQSLYVKLRRFGLGELDGDPGEERAEPRVAAARGLAREPADAGVEPGASKAA